MSTLERSFICASLTTEGSVSTRGRSGRVIMDTDSEKGGVISVAFSRHGRDGLIEWITRRLAEGETVILHPDTSVYKTEREGA